ncbi:thiamine pyrophosphate-dependent enzyme [Thermocladium modestius]|nr:thiamine pyrophosphate-dependent enzyme [Thermocladium modestius]
MQEGRQIRTIKDLPREERFAPGHAMCAGCGAAIAMRWLNKYIGDNAIIANATGCVEVTTTTYPYTAWRNPWIHVAFENAAAVASGLRKGIDVLKRKGAWKNGDTRIVVVGGDGGTVDIGLQSLSGMLERGDKVMYFLYDNEAYMNTGIQRSGATPMYAWTTTTPVGHVLHGKPQMKKDIFDIVLAHGIKYAATATISDVIDMSNKIRKAMDYSEEGPTFIHVLSPCPPGWKYDESKTVEVAKKAIETAYWINLEYDHGVWSVTTKVPVRKPVSEFLRMQGRFSHLTQGEVEEIQKWVDARVASVNKLVGKEVIGPVKER